MSEQCHEWRDGDWFVHREFKRDGRMWVADSVYLDGYCPTCGTKLLPDGTEQAMVPAVTPEAVAATRLWQVAELCKLHQLDARCADVPEATWEAVHQLGWLDDDGETTEEFATIHAAIQQAREPGDPSDGELLDALEGIARDWWSQDEAGELSLVTMDMPIPESMCPLQEKTTLRDLARAIITAQRGGKE